jgi:Holliday junction resolvase RusA-like endonuclease|tara:strand:+ start:1755 stop:2153 length:399 start_codon:yes stop_codon:yes gene_type:complete
MEKRTFFIPFSTPSSKNGKRWTGKHMIHSKTVMTYLKNTKPFWVKESEEFRALIDKLQKPVEVSFKFLRGTRHKFDYVNPLQTIQDQMTTHGWIEDDNCDEIIPHFEKYEYNKEEPGCYITILETNKTIKDG